MALDTPKISLTTALVLAFPELKSPLVVETDALATAVGEVLTQKKDGRVHLIQYASRTLNGAERKYSVGDREALAVIFGLRKFRIYILSALIFYLIAGHQAF